MTEKTGRLSSFIRRPEQAQRVEGPASPRLPQKGYGFFDALRLLRMTCKTEKALKFPLSLRGPLGPWQSASPRIPYAKPTSYQKNTSQRVTRTNLSLAHGSIFCHGGRFSRGGCIWRREFQKHFQVTSATPTLTPPLEPTSLVTFLFGDKKVTRPYAPPTFPKELRILQLRI